MNIIRRVRTVKRTIIVTVSISLVLIASLVLVTVLTALHDDSTQLVVLFSTGVLPTVTSMFAYHQASSAKDKATEAAKNTNGLLHQVINKAEAAGVDVGLENDKPRVNRVRPPL